MAVEPQRRSAPSASLAPKTSKLLLGREIDTHLPCLHGCFDGGGHLLEFGDPAGQQRVLAAQVVLRTRCRAVEQHRDLFEREAEFPVEQDLLQPVEVGVAVTPVTRVAAPAGRKQSDPVVVVQGRTVTPANPATCPTEKSTALRSLLLSLCTSVRRYEPEPEP